jgi:hypothetical protein
MVDAAKVIEDSVEGILAIPPDAIEDIYWPSSKR